MTIASRTHFLFVAAAAITTMLSPMPLQAQNTNTTIQEGRININRTVQYGDSNDNSTYQSGMVNINRTIQLGSDNRNQTGQFGQVNDNRTIQRDAPKRAQSKRGGAGRGNSGHHHPERNKGNRRDHRRDER